MPHVCPHPSEIPGLRFFTLACSSESWLSALPAAFFCTSCTKREPYSDGVCVGGGVPAAAKSLRIAQSAQQTRSRSAASLAAFSFSALW